MIKLYRFDRIKIISEEFDRVTNNYAFKNGRREQLCAKVHCWFTTPEAAIQDAESILTTDVAASRKRLEYHIKQLYQLQDQKSKLLAPFIAEGM